MAEFVKFSSAFVILFWNDDNQLGSILRSSGNVFLSKVLSLQSLKHSASRDNNSGLFLVHWMETMLKNEKSLIFYQVLSSS